MANIVCAPRAEGITTFTVPGPEPVMLTIPFKQNDQKIEAKACQEQRSVLPTVYLGLLFF